MEEKTEIKNRILKAAYELFKKFGFRSISMDDIARQLGMSKKTLYQSFADKDEIVTLAMEEYIAHQEEELKELRAHTTDAIDFLVRMNETLTRNIKDTNTALVHELKKYHAHAWSLIEKFRNEFLFTIIVDDLQSGIREGNFRSDFNPHVIAKVRLEETSLALDDNVFPKDEFNFGEVSLALLDHFMHGITTDKGKKIYNQYKSQNQNNLITSV